MRIRSLIRFLSTVLLALTAAQDASAAATAAAPAGLEKATFAGGCFWCMELPFRGLTGVSSVLSGYTGGGLIDPSYEDVSAGHTGHAEAVEIVFDPRLISYDRLLDIFWHNVDPTVKDRQFCDAGNQYRSAIFVHSAAQRAAAEATKAAVQANPRFKDQTIHTEIVDAGPFYAAESYHQDYAHKNPAHYRFYRWNCGRDARLEAVWGAAPAH